MILDNGSNDLDNVTVSSYANIKEVAVELVALANILDICDRISPAKSIVYILPAYHSTHPRVVHYKENRLIFKEELRKIM